MEQGNKQARKTGRPLGSPNKATADVRKAIALLASRNVPKLEKWLAAVASEDPARASDILLRALEYHIPKLGRTEVSGPDGSALKVAISIDLGDKDGA